jgi:adenylate cyclase
VRRASASDPDYAVSWEQLARLLLQFYIQPYGEAQGDPAVLDEARKAAERAVLLDPGFSTAYAARGFALSLTGEFDASLADLRKAVALNPNDYSAMNNYADVLSRAGLHRESIEASQKAARLDPFSNPLSLALEARAYVLLDEFEPALTLTQSCAERAPKLLPCYLFLAIAAHGLGDSDKARSAVERVLDIDPNYSIQKHLPYDDESTVKLEDYMRRVGLPG